MTIWYDLTELYFRSSGKLRFYGIARVVAEIAFEMATLYPQTVFVVFDESRRQFFRIDPVFDASSEAGPVSLGIDRSTIPAALRILRQNAAPPRKIAARISNAITRFRDRKLMTVWPGNMQPVTPDHGVLFTAARPKIVARMVSHLEKNRSPVRLSILLHDLIPLFENYASGRNARNFREDNSYIIGHADQIIANSAFTMKTIDTFAANGRIATLPENRIVVPLAHECRAAGEDRWTPPERPYLLAVGITTGRKNLEAVLTAQQMLIDKGVEPPLLIIAGAYRARMVQELQRRFPAFSQHVQLLDSPSQSRLNSLYRHAVATVMPSRMEGWGLPAGESMWQGTPAILARTSSLPEVGGDLACYFDPDRPEELAEILSDHEKLDVLRERLAAEKHRLRSWAMVAEDIHSALRTLLVADEALRA